jgi:hypothetical protein
MSSELPPGASNVLRFPAERRAAPSIETVQNMAPPRAFVASILDERGLPLTDIHGEFARQTARQAMLLDARLGRDGTVLQLRAALDGHIAQAVRSCAQCQEAADRMIALEVRAEALRRKTPWMRGALSGDVSRARAEYRDQALAARGAADAALGFAEALAVYIRSGPGWVADRPQLLLPLLLPVAAAG